MSFVGAFILKLRADAPVGNTDFDLHAHLAGLAGMIEETKTGSRFTAISQQKKAKRSTAV